MFHPYFFAPFRHLDQPQGVERSSQLRYCSAAEIFGNGAHRMEESIAEHRQILAAKSPQAFADAVECNILNGFRNLTKSL